MNVIDWSSCVWNQLNIQFDYKEKWLKDQPDQHYDYKGLTKPLLTNHLSTGNKKVLQINWALLTVMLTVTWISGFGKKSHKYPNFPKMCQIHPLMSNYEINFWLWNQILHIKNEWNLPSLSLALFFFNQN